MSSSEEESRKTRLKFTKPSRKARKVQKPTKKKKQTRMYRKETKPKKPVDTDRDSLMTAAETDDEKENLSYSDHSMKRALERFQDTPSPELVREAHHSRDYHFDSPVRQRRDDAANPVSIDLGECETFLSLNVLPHFLSCFEEKDETLTRKDSLVIGKATKKNSIKKFYTRLIDPYRFPQPEDPTFGRTKKGIPKMRLNEYLEKCRSLKSLDLMPAGPSGSKNGQITSVPEKKSLVPAKRTTRKRAN